MIKLLENLPPTECPKFLHRVVDSVCGRDAPRLRDYGKVWSLPEWTELLDGLSLFFRVAVGRKCSEEELQESLADLGSAHREAVLACLKGREAEIRHALVERTNDVSSAQLQDFDWQIKLALSSDKLSSLQMPLLSLTLDVKQGGVMKPVSLELSREELNALINNLEAANKVVLQLK
ncbi:hypothetical protein GJAV_G00067300 [Gymnothorax javanicus]|nr:hypothetical protein GJAV_G00067300 [Gymnothorax javanicus]